MISDSNEQLQQELEYTLLKPDCYSWWISKMQSGHEDTLKERYALKFCFKLGKNSTRQSIHQNWLAKGLGLGLLCWGFKGVQKEIPSEEASTLQIGSMAFPSLSQTIWPRWASRQFLSLSIVQTLLPLTFVSIEKTSPHEKPCFKIKD